MCPGLEWITVSYFYPLVFFFFFFFGSIYIPAYSSTNKPGRSYEPLHMRNILNYGSAPESKDGKRRVKGLNKGQPFRCAHVKIEGNREEGRNDVCCV
jgi:hypothetical protein